jgi:predicted metalloprotease with PDZ domain
VLRLAWQRFAGERGFTGAEIEALASEVAGEDLAAFFDRAPAQHRRAGFQSALLLVRAAFRRGPAPGAAPPRRRPTPKAERGGPGPAVEVEPDLPPAHAARAAPVPTVDAVEPPVDAARRRTGATACPARHRRPGGNGGAAAVDPSYRRRRRKPGWLGVQTRLDGGRLLVVEVRRGTPAFDAGISVDDELLAIDDFRVPPAGLAERLAFYRPGDRVSVVVARRERLLRLDAVLGEDPGEGWRLAVDPRASDEQRRGWRLARRLTRRAAAAISRGLSSTTTTLGSGHW